MADIECFQVVARLIMDDDGQRWVNADVYSETDDTLPDLHEVLGVLDMAKDEVKSRYAEEEG